MSEKTSFEEVIEKFPFPKICDSCIHKAVCKNYKQEEIIEKNKCYNYMGESNPKTYGNIYNMFEPVFQWMEENYPSDDIHFIVERNGAKMFIEHGPFVLCKSLRQNFEFYRNEEKTSDQQN